MSGRHTPNPVMTYTICADIGELRGIFPSPVFMFVTRFSEPHFSFVLSCTTFWCHLWSITVQTHGNMESGILHWCSSFNYFWIGSKCCWFQMLLVSNTASSRCCTKLRNNLQLWEVRVTGFDDSWFRANEKQAGSYLCYREQSLRHECLWFGIKQ